jgi:hypothetical protein
MKLNLAQKIGLGGISFVLIVAFVFYLGNYFSGYIFTGIIPFSVLILIGYSVQNSNKQKRLPK